MRQLLAVFALLVASIVSAAELRVPEQFATIQGAISASVDADTIVVAPGTYYEPLDLMGRIITLKSSGGAGVTILDGSRHDASIMKAVFGEKRGTVVQGFTFRNGKGTVTDACNIHGRFGGAILVKNSGLSVVDCVFENNGEKLEVIDDRNVSGGGAIYVCQSDFYVSASRFDNNKAGRGGAIHVEAGSLRTAEIVDCTFNDNQSSHGGAIYALIYSSAIFDLSGSRFDRNRSSFGAGVRVETLHRASARIADSHFSNGVSSGGAGVHLDALDSSTIEVTRSDFTANEAGFGGGLYAHAFGDAASSSRVRVTHCRFFDNIAHNCCNTGIYFDACFVDGRPPQGSGLYYGGGADVRTYGGGSVTVTNSLFAGNSGDRGGGAHGSTCDGGSIQFTNNTVVGNTGSGLHMRVGAPRDTPVAKRAELRITNSIVRQNVNGDQIALEPNAAAGDAGVTFSAVQGGFAGEGNIDAAPSFLDAPHRDFRLAEGSAGIDAGDNSAVDSNVTTDLQRRTRFADDPKTHDRGAGHAPIVDIGAYEFQPPPVRRHAARH
jgi:predicted outer membrane repeat protein